MYDFDKDSFITKEDIRLILSHIPVDNAITGVSVSEGSFTTEGGGHQIFLDRIQTQEEIENLISEIFGAKKRLSFEEYVRINQEITSEMFLSIIILLQQKLPCSENFYRYKKNYEKYMVTNKDAGDQLKPETDKPQLIASPRHISKLSPIQSLNFNPATQKIFLKDAVNKLQTGDQSSEADKEIGIPILAFKSAKDL